jgi:glycolate oxidase
MGLSAELIRQLNAELGADQLLTDTTSRVLYAQDVFTRDKPAIAVVRPTTTEQLAKAIQLLTEAGHAVIGRGGGMSYTKGYVPSDNNSVIIDTSMMQQILDINRDDMYVTVQAGCTWKSLHEALKNTGLRTPFWGPLSGIHATVGGSVSNSSVYWGAGLYGSSSDSVISMDVVLANGDVLSTGSAAQINAAPFFRHFGPDLTGLFTCDSGALGIKATVTLRLIPQAAAYRYCSYDFENYTDQVNAMSEIARHNLVAQMFGIDPGLGQIRARRDRLLNDVKALAGVMKAQDSLFNAVKEGAKIALAGRNFIKEASYPLHATIEERCDAAAEHVAEEVAAICKKFGGKPIENTIPKVLQANPFNPLNNMVGPDGERWVPVNGLFPHSKVLDAVQRTEAVYAKYADVIAEQDIICGFLFTTISTNCFFVEPLWFWPDELNELHKTTVEAAVLSKQKGFAENQAARQAVTAMRGELADIFSAMGASHLQLGKTYHYADVLKPEALQLIKAIKQIVDPQRRINPGCLGL